MSRFIVANPRTGDAYQTDFAELVDLIKGTTITSLADSDQFLELGLSENLQIRMEHDDRGGLQVIVFSTLNESEVRPVRLQIINDGEEPNAALVGRRLYNLRQVYAITLLLDTGREKDLADLLLKEPRADLERALLAEDERLLVQAGGPGTWWITVLTKIGGAPQTALNGLSLIYGKGRTLLLERVQAATEIKKEEATAKALANEKARDQRIIDLAKALEKIKDPEGRAAIQSRLHSELNSANPQLAGPTIAGLLPAPE